MKCFHFNLKKLLEEIETNKDKIENCHKDAKTYIDSVKVRTHTFSFARNFISWLDLRSFFWACLHFVFRSFLGL